LNIITNGQERMFISTTGKVGIGTSSPQHPLSLASTNSRTVLALDNGSAASASSELRFLKDGAQRWGLGCDFGMNGDQDLYIWDHLANEGAGATRLRIDEAGKVVIGDVDVTPYNPYYDYKLYVQGGLLTERVKVAIRTSIEWSDHVFLPGYQLMPLKEVSQFIAENGHLPGVPSAECMVEDGLDVVKTDAMLLEKIEELTLHTIDLNTRLEHAERMIATLMEQLTRTTE
jgi:hypothetical protein